MNSTNIKIEAKTSEKTTKACEKLLLSREKLLDSLEKLLDSREKLLSSREKLLSSREKLLSSREKLLDSREKLPSSREKLLTSREKLLDSREKGPGFTRKTRKTLEKMGISRCDTMNKCSKLPIQINYKHGIDRCHCWCGTRRVFASYPVSGGRICGNLDRTREISAAEAVR